MKTLNYKRVIIASIVTVCSTSCHNGSSSANANTGVSDSPSQKATMVSNRDTVVKPNLDTVRQHMTSPSMDSSTTQR